MDDTQFDRALVAAAFAEAGAGGWRRVSVAGAARAAGLDLARARARFPGRCAVLLAFGRLADQAALAGVTPDAPVRDTLFDMLMRRIDVLQAHRAGVVALLRAAPMEPPVAALLAAASLRSMAWLLGAAGVRAGLLTPLRAKALLAVWLWTVRTWQRDETADLAPTMAALDHALARAEAAEAWLRGRRREPPSPKPTEGDADGHDPDAEPA